MNRREFTQLSALLPFAGMLPNLAMADTATSGKASEALKTPAIITGKRILVLVELAGGNDGLNTLIPLTNRAQYEKLRPTLAQKKSLDIGSGVGMHTALGKLLPLWEEGQLSWIQSVGYPTPDLSHFRSKDIWETASSSDQQRTDGWLSLALPKKDRGLQGVVVGSGLGPMAGKDCRAVAMHDPRTFLAQADLVERVNHQTTNPSLAHVLDVQQQVHGAKHLLNRSARVRHMDRHFRPSNFNNDLKSVAKMIVGGADVMVYKVTLPGFDTHADQAVLHQNQLSYLAEGLHSFSKAMKAARMWDNVMVMTYSEFGRSAKENLSGGTDHGTAAPHIVMGGKVKGGQLYGDKADLKNLNSEGDLNYSTDFRAIYATVAENWWGQKNPWEQHTTLDFI
ncbi:MAG: DUF1501 domain-containing protein [Thiotrichaceae bacterium]